MSQAKVDRYKEEKRNREKLIKKEKRQWMAAKVGISAVAIAAVVWVGVSVYNGSQSEPTNAERQTYTVKTSALDDFMQGVTTEE